jgi:hypothetical protein
MGARPWRAVLVALALLAVASAGNAHPFHEGAGCGRWYSRWRSSHSCSFMFHGPPVQVYGNAQAKGRAHLRVWITAETPAGEVTLVECSGSDSRFVSCDNTQPQMSYLADLGVDQVTITCHVQGRVRGQYWCASGGGVPIPP